MKYIFIKKLANRPSRRYIIFSLFFLIAVLLLILSCDTTKPYLKSTEPALQTAELNEIYVECLYLNYNDLEKKHGFKGNPFLPPELGLTPKQMIVFDLKITNNDSAPVVLNIKDVELNFGDKKYSPMSHLDMDLKIEEYAERNYILQENRVAKKFMFPYVTTVRGNSTTSGYMVFMGTFRGNNVPTELILSFKTADKNSAADITFAYTLTLMKK